jgi:hypothetical protein
MALVLLGLAPQGSEAERAIRLQIDGPARVGKYEKVEFRLQGDRVFDNPFDPAEVDFSLELRTPSGKTLILPAFYYQHYERQQVARGGRKADWFYPVDPPGWRARFAPTEVGTYSCQARWKDRNEVSLSDPVTFECSPSQSRGYVRVSEKDPRFLEFADGTPFFPLGQNVAFIGPTQYLNTYGVEVVFQKMSENGANFARVWTCCADWALAIEARKSAWGRSWDWKPSIVPQPGMDGYYSDRTCVKIAGEEGASVAVSPSHPVALRPNTSYQVSGLMMAEADAGLSLEVNGARLGDALRSEKPGEWAEFKREFTTAPEQWWLDGLALRLIGKGSVWVRQLSLQEAAGGPELLWEANLDRPLRGDYNLLDSFMLDTVVEAAEKNGIYLQLCLITRDLYMGSLTDENSLAYHRAIDDAKHLLRYAVARWGYSSHVAVWEYFNEMNPGLPTNRFYRELGQYLEQVDVYRHLRATSAWGPSPKDWTHPQLDNADHHWYLRPAWGELWKDEVAAVLDRAGLVRKHAPNKPALLSEFGLATDEWGNSPYMDEDKEWVHFHNALWASALSGLSGAAAFWWWEHLDQGNAYPHYRPLAVFLAGVPFTMAQLQAISATTSPKSCRVLGLQGKDCAYLWVFNPQATWWKMVVEKAVPEEIKGEAVTVGGLEPGTYRVQWWHTWEGNILKEETLEVSDRRLQLAVPAFARDLACKITKQ